MTAAILLIAVRGNTQALIPLFAIGVFTGFTLSQTGMVVHWRTTRTRRWRYRAIINGTGAVVTALATVIFLATKFTEGAWVVVIAVPLLIVLFTRIHRTTSGPARPSAWAASLPGRPPSPPSSSSR